MNKLWGIVPVLGGWPKLVYVIFQRKTKGHFFTLSRTFPHFFTRFQNFTSRTSLKIKAIFKENKEKDQTILHISCRTFVLLWFFGGHSFWGREEHINKTPTKFRNPVNILLLVVFLIFGGFMRSQSTQIPEKLVGSKTAPFRGSASWGGFFLKTVVWQLYSA